MHFRMDGTDREIHCSLSVDCLPIGTTSPAQSVCYASRATSQAMKTSFTGEPQVLAGRTCHRRAATMVIPVWGQELSGQPRADPGLLGISSDEQHCTPPFLLRLQGLLTLFTEFFASFVHTTSALSVPGRYASLRWIHIALQTAVPSRSNRGCSQPHPGEYQCTAKHMGRSPCSVGPFQDFSWHWISSRTQPTAP